VSSYTGIGTDIIFKWRKDMRLYWRSLKLGTLVSLFLFGFVFINPGWSAETREEPLTLDQALQIAMEKNKDIQKAKEYRNQVEGRYLEERAAALPQLQIQAGISRARDESQTAYGKLFPVERELRSAGIGLNQLVYSFGAVEAAIRAAKIGIATADDQLRLYQQAALKDVTAAFYDVLLVKELNRIARQNLEQKKRHLEESQKKYASGVATDYDVLAAKVDVENARPAVIRTENQIITSLDRLRFLLGLRRKEIDIQGSLEKAIGGHPNFDEALKSALENRPELANLKHRLGIAEELVRIAKTGNLPKINLQAGYGWQELDFTTSRADGPTWIAGLYLNFPFFDGLRTQGKVTQAKSEMATLKIEEAKLVDGIVLQTREAVNGVIEAGEIVKALSGTVEQAERLLLMAEKGYEYGVKTRLDVDDAQLNVVQSQGNLSRSKRDYLVALMNLEWVMGTIRPPDVRR
jgi:outer membrane protein TolC